MFIRLMIYTAFTSKVSAKIKQSLAKLINKHSSLIENDMKAFPTVKSLHDVHRNFLFDDRICRMDEFISELKEFERNHNGIYIDIWKIPETEFIRKMKTNTSTIVRTYGQLIE